MKQYPHELSGGICQRVVIAMALSSGPQLLIADEPTTALDVTIQAQILDLLLEFKHRSALSVLLISHDIAVVSEVADRIAVMYAGRIVEEGGVRDIVEDPLHPYTRSLIAAMPSMEREVSRLPVLADAPNGSSVTEGCKFAPRCEFREAACEATDVALETTKNGRRVACVKWKCISEVS